MNLQLRGLGVLVTGGSSGVGNATVRRAIVEGASVVSFDRTPFPASKWMPGKKYPSAFCGDVRDGLPIQQIEGAVNLSAIVLAAALGPFDRCSPEEIFLTNYDAAVKNALEFGRSRQNGGAILLFSSTAAFRHTWGREWDGLFEEALEGPRHIELRRRVRTLEPREAYSLSKWGILWATHRLSRLFAIARIRVNCIALGPTKTEMSRSLWQEHAEDWERLVNESPFNTYCTPDEVSASAAFLISPLARMVTNSIIHEDGAWHTANARD